MVIQSMTSVSYGTQTSGKMQEQLQSAIRGFQTAGSSDTNQIYDKKDLNQDGYVSPLEEYLYYWNHPGESVKATTNTQYNALGEMNTRSNQMPQFINITI